MAQKTRNVTLKLKVTDDDLALLKKAAHLIGRQSVAEYIGRAVFAYTEFLFQVVAEKEAELKAAREKAEKGTEAADETQVELPASTSAPTETTPSPSGIILARG